MKRKSVTKKIARSTEDAARLKAVREKFQRDKPSLMELVASGQYERAAQRDYFSLLELVAGLKQARQAKQLSLSEVERLSGIDKAQLSRIENGLNPNPTWSTLEAISRAIGVRMRISFETSHPSS